MFRPIDADDSRTNGENAGDFSNLRQNGLIRILFTLPSNIRLIDPATNQPSAGDTFDNGRPQELWRGPYSHGMSSSCGAPGFSSSNYDVTPDGERFLMIQDEDVATTSSDRVVLVLGFAQALHG